MMYKDEEQKPLLATTNTSSSRRDGFCCSSDSQQTPCCNEPKDDYCHLVDQPWQYKAVALACALFLAVGSHFAAHTLGAMKNTIKKEFGISNSQYGVLQSSVSIVNTILPVLGGLFLDAFGTAKGSILTTGLITLGNVLVAASTSRAHLPSMIVGRILYGVGSGTVVIVQETILSQWFKGRSLAAVVALMMTVSRLASFLAQATVVPIANWTGWYGYGFWFSATLCIFSLIVNLIYLALLRNVSSYCQQQQQQQVALVQKRKKSFRWSNLLYLPHSFWLIAAMEFLLGGAWGCFLHINSEYVKSRFGYDNARAAATASLAQILPIFLMPILGVCVDRYGKRTWMMLGSAMTFFGSLVSLQYTQLTPVIGMLLFSVSLALGPVGLVSSVPVILPLSLVGTGIGLIKSGTNIGASLFDIATGLLQDADPRQGYSSVVLFFLGVGALACLAAVVLWILDRTIYNSLLDQSAKEAKEKTDAKSWLDTSQFREKLWVNYIYAFIYVFLATLSWMLFFRFVLFH